MKKFILQIGILVLVVLTIAIGADYMISSGLRKTDIRKYAVWNDIYNGANLNNDLVILGASCAWCSYNTYVLDSMLSMNTYNLGLDAHTWFYYKLRYNTYIRYCNKRPQIVIINIDHGTFGTPDNMFEREQFFPYFRDDSLICAVKDLKKFTVAEQYVPCWRYFGYQDEINIGVKSFFGEDNFDESGTYKGYLGRNESFALESLATDTVFDLICDSSTVASFRDFVRNLTIQGVKVILVKYPMYHPLQTRIANLTEMDSLYHKLSIQLNVPLLDYWNDDFTYDTTYYYNPSHMNQFGAELFSLQLADSLKSIIK